MNNKLFYGLDSIGDDYTSLSEDAVQHIKGLKNRLEKGFNSRTLSSKQMVEYNLYSRLLKNRYDLTEVLNFLNRAESRIVDRDVVLKDLYTKYGIYARGVKIKARYDLGYHKEFNPHDWVK